MRFFLTLSCFLFVTLIPAADAAWLPTNRTARHMDTGDGEDQEFSMSDTQIRAWQNSLKKYTEQYDLLLSRLGEDPKRFKDDIRSLKNSYTLSEYYTPFPNNLLDLATHYAYVVDTSEDSKEVNDAILNFRELVNSHLVNLDILDFALTMSQLDVRFGDANFYKSVRDFLVEEITIQSEYCSTAQRACRVITYGEESYLLQQNGGTVKSSEIFHVAPHYYNVHTIEREDGTTSRFFVDVTTPIVNVMKTRFIYEREEGEDLELQ